MFEPVLLNPMRTGYKPMPQRVQITFHKEQFNLFHIEPECKIYATELGTVTQELPDVLPTDKIKFRAPLQSW